MTNPTEYADGGTVTLSLTVNVAVSAANPEFTRDDVIAHAVETLGAVGEYAHSHHNVTFLTAETMEVTPA